MHPGHGLLVNVRWPVANFIGTNKTILCDLHHLSCEPYFCLSSVAKILESATFMEALEAAGTALPKKRRRKLSSSAETPPPTVTKPSFKVWLFFFFE